MNATMAQERQHMNVTLKWYKTIGRNTYRFRVVRYSTGKTVCVAERQEGKNRWVEVHNLTFRKGS